MTTKRDELNELRRKACEQVRSDVADGSITEVMFDAMAEAYVRTLTRAELRELVGETVPPVPVPVPVTEEGTA